MRGSNTFHSIKTHYQAGRKLFFSYKQIAEIDLSAKRVAGKAFIRLEGQKSFFYAATKAMRVQY